MRRYHRDKRAEVTIALHEAEANGRYASVEIDDDGTIVAFDGGARTSGLALVNGGVYLAESGAFSGVPPEPAAPVSLEDQLYPRMLAAGSRMYGFRSSGRFIDIGVPEDYRRAAAMLSATRPSGLMHVSRLRD